MNRKREPSFAQSVRGYYQFLGDMAKGAGPLVLFMVAVAGICFGTVWGFIWLMAQTTHPVEFGVLVIVLFIFGAGPYAFHWLRLDL